MTYCRRLWRSGECEIGSTNRAIASGCIRAVKSHRAIELPIAVQSRDQTPTSSYDGPAIAYHHSVYDAILIAIPEDPFLVARLVRTLERGSGESMRQMLRLLGVQTAEERDAFAPPHPAAAISVETYGLAEQG